MNAPTQAYAEDMQRSAAVWIEASDIPADLGGPVDTPFRRLPPPSQRNLGLEDIERTAELHADKTAIFDGAVRLNYAEVLDRVYGLAARLAEHLEPRAAIASLVHNGAAAPIIIMASAAAGLTLVPIDAGHPLERATAIFEESGASALVLASGEEVDDSFVPLEVPRIRFDCRMASGAPRFVSRPAPPHTPLFVIFTSGSTGRPKGLAYDRTDGIVRTVEAFHVNSSDVIIGLASLSTGGARDAFLALTTGATIRIVDVKREGIGGILRVLGEEGVTLLSFVPTVLRAVMSAPGVEQALRHLRVLDLHGEATLESDVALFRSKLPPGCHISITFSATETGPIFAWFVQEERFERGVVPIGYIFPGKSVAVVAEDGSPVAPGETGELFVRGQMAAGSWRGGRLSQARFIADPHSPGQRIYQTGDLVRLRSDGLAEFAGRRDRQIKIRGLWADLVEIEAALKGVDEVADAVALVQSREEQHAALAAFVVVREGREPPSKAMLRQRVTQATAEHMAPAVIAFVDEIPRLANYKPDLVRLDRMLAEITGAERA